MFNTDEMIRSIDSAIGNGVVLDQGKIKYTQQSAIAYLEKIYSVIVDTPELANIFAGKQYNYGHIAPTINPVNLIEWLIYRTNNFNSREAVGSLQRFIKAEQTPAYLYLALSGITIKETIKLNDTLSLIPLKSLRETPQKYLSGPKETEGSPSMLGSHVADAKYPQVVLQKSISFSKVLNQQSDFYPINEDLELDELCTFLSFRSAISPMIYHKWTELEDWVPKHLSTLTGLHGGSSEFNYRNLVLFTSEDWDELAPLYQKFRQLSNHDRETIGVALRRITHSKVRWSKVDRAIDLGVALEAILLAPNEKNNITHKFRERASSTLATNPNEIQDIKSFFNKFYDCRCSAVHNGIIKDSYRSMPVNEFLDQATEYALNILKVFIIQGHVTNWVE